MSQYIAIVKLAYVPVSNPDDEVIPGNIAALEKGLEARKAGRARDNERETQLWAEAEQLLIQEAENETGPAAEGSVQVEDTYFIEGMSGVYGGYSYTMNGNW